jgi:hypothetical protein
MLKRQWFDVLASEMGSQQWILQPKQEKF